MLNPSPETRELLESAGDSLTLRQLVNALASVHPEHNEVCRLCNALADARRKLKAGSTYWASNSETIRPISSR